MTGNATARDTDPVTLSSLSTASTSVLCWFALKLANQGSRCFCRYLCPILWLSVTAYLGRLDESRRKILHWRQDLDFSIWCLSWISFGLSRAAAVCKRKEEKGRDFCVIISMDFHIKDLFLKEKWKPLEKYLTEASHWRAFK